MVLIPSKTQKKAPVASTGATKRKVAATKSSATAEVEGGDAETSSAPSVEGAVQPVNPLSARVEPVPTASGLSLEELAASTGTNAARINQLRRAGVLPADSYTKSGKSFVYTDAAVQAIKSAAGTKVPRASAPAAKRPRTAGPASGDDAIAANLDSAIAATEERLVRLKAARKALGR